jgi:hypothetical protein
MNSASSGSKSTRAGQRQEFAWRHIEREVAHGKRVTVIALLDPDESYSCRLRSRVRRTCSAWLMHTLGSRRQLTSDRRDDGADHAS